MGLVFSRSPITRGALGTAATFAHTEMDLYIYQGTLTTDRADGVYYSLFASWHPDLDTPAQDSYSIDIAPYVRDFIESTYDGTWANSDNEIVWVDYRTRTVTTGGTPSAWSGYTQYYCSEGYGYFNEAQDSLSGGYVHETETNECALIEPGTTLYVPDGELLTIPILREEFNTNYDLILTDGSNTEAASVSFTIGTSPTESTNAISYWTENGTYDYIRLEQDHPTNPNTVLNYIERVTEYKGTPIKVVFKNRWGALQEMWFFGKTTLRMATSNDEFNRKPRLDYLGLLTSEKHAKVIYNKKGLEYITLNSGFQVEANNELFRQLMLSEYVWMHYDGDVLPVNITDSDIQYKTSLNDKLINYTINFEFAFEKILA